MMCINNTFIPATIPVMKEMHERMKRLYEAAREAGYLTGDNDQSTLARLLNVAPQNVSNWESRGPSGEAVLKAQEALGISATWILKGTAPKFVGGDRPKPPPHGIEMDSDHRPDLVSVRKVIFKISGGIAGFSVDYLDNGEGVPLFFSKSWVDKRGYDPKKLYAAKVSGQSMEPTLFNADLIVVNTGDTEKEDGAVYAVNYEGEFTVKRLIRDMREWWLVSDNPDQKRFPRKMCHDGTYLLGRVVHRQGEHL
ncbi:S24 family peptidase [Achromobacter anxifer]|uniref:S24 family peptidase n=1 Tax=Achromobacter anxifer TaxID=1287737 RepID=UPI0023F9CD4B|nr:S24 family peptidase [Achromobacter anxifer]MDF8361916.1 S24 family peptidase [Achromobacter anxifer]